MSKAPRKAKVKKVTSKPVVEKEAVAVKQVEVHKKVKVVPNTVTTATYTLVPRPVYNDYLFETIIVAATVMVAITVEVSYIF